MGGLLAFFILLLSGIAVQVSALGVLAGSAARSVREATMWVQVSFMGIGGVVAYYGNLDQPVRGWDAVIPILNALKVPSAIISGDPVLWHFLLLAVSSAIFVAILLRLSAWFLASEQTVSKV